MVSKNLLKQLGQLGQKKFRKEYGLFSVEGKKAIATFLTHNFELVYCFSLENEAQSTLPAEIITPSNMKRVSNLSTPSSYWAAFKLPSPKAFAPQPLHLALDGVRDPGNLGTIIRLCDWFGLNQLICSPDTVDCFNPKVVQASMGSLAKVHVHYVDLTSFIHHHNLSAVGTAMYGENMYNATLPSNAVLVMGNEGKGISGEVKAILQKSVVIPSYGSPAAESLNVAMATGILLSEFLRKK